MKKSLELGTVLFVVALTFCGSAFAQATGALTGTVHDNSQAVIPGVTITATNTQTGVTARAISNESGAYHFPSLLPGAYELAASLPGFQTARFRNIALGANQTLRYNFALEVATVTTSVEVSLDAQDLLALDSSSIGETLSDARVTELPLVGGDVLDLVNIMAGARQSPAGAQFDTFAGVTASSINTVRDGLSVSDGRFANGIFGTTTISPDLVGEIRLILAPVDAEVGRGNGQVQITTRSGTNRFTGGAVWNFRNTALNSNTWDNNRNIDAVSGLWNPDVPDWQNQNQYTVSFSGPIFRNRTFFFALWDQQLNNTRDVVRATVLTEPARQGIFRYIERWNNDNAAAGTTSTTRPVVDYQGNPLLTNPNGTIGTLRCFSVFGDIKADGSPFTASDCPGGSVILPSQTSLARPFWDPKRPGMDPTGFIARFQSLMPPVTHYDGGDGLNTAIHQWVRGSNATGSTFGVAVGTNPNAERKQFNIKIDHNFNQNHKASGGLTIERTNGGVNLSNWPDGFNGETSRRPWILTTSVTSTISPTLLNEARFGVRKSVLAQNPTWDSVSPETRQSARSFFLEGAPGHELVFFPGSGNLTTSGTGFTGSNSPYPGGSLNGNVTPLYNIGDTLSWTRGTHAFRFGGEARFTSSNGYSNIPAQPLPDVRGGAGGNTATGIAANNGLTGLQSTNQTRARNLLYYLAGSVDSATTQYWIENFQDVESGTWHGYEDRERNWRRHVQNEYAIFFKDDWKMLNSLTLNLGLRWEYYAPPFIDSGFTTTLVDTGAGLFGVSRTGRPDAPFNYWMSPGQIYLSGYGPNGSLECVSGVSQGTLPVSNCDPALLSLPRFVGPNSPNPDESVYNADRNNFGPAVGFAWQVPWLGEGRTTVRGGYQITYGGTNRDIFGDGARIGGALGATNRATMNVADALARTPNSYLDLTTLDAVVPIEPTIVPGGTLPVYSRSGNFAAFDPNLATPYVQNFTLSVTRNVRRNMTVDVRYIGTQSKKQIGTLALNTPNVFFNPELLDALERTRRGENATLFDQMFAGVNLNSGVAVSGGAPYTAVGTVNADGILQTGSMHLRRAQSANLANGNYAAVVDYINTQGPSGTVTGLLAAPFSNVGGRLLRNGCDRMANGQATIGQANNSALRCFPENYIVTNPQFDTNNADYVTNSGSSNYHSMQAQFTLRPTFGTNFQATYTWSKTMELPAENHTNPLDRKADYRLAFSHIAHDFRVNGTFQLPFGPNQLLFGNSSGIFARAIEGWKMSWIFNTTSGSPRTISAQSMLYNNGTPDVVGPWTETRGKVQWGKVIGGNNVGGSFFGDRYVQVEDPQCAPGGITDFTDAMGWNLRADSTTGAEICTLDAVALASTGQIVLQNPHPGKRGTLGLTSIERFGLYSVDASLSKQFQVGERHSIQLRFDANNILNHPTPNDPQFSINTGSDAGFGNINGKGNQNRTFQAQVRFNF
jgi:hypothetical protein